MMCSEAWVCNGEDSLAFILADAGFDVWLGNNRGNRYSGKHTRLRPSEDEYWNFSLDEMARFDVPAMVDYVLKVTGREKLAYVGFSNVSGGGGGGRATSAAGAGTRRTDTCLRLQGTAQCFAALSTQPDLQQKLSVFVALSAAIAVKGPCALAMLQSCVHCNCCC